MPLPPLSGLVNGSLGLCFRAVEAVLREDPVLARVVRTWRTMQGDPGEMDPPSEGQFPWLRLTIDTSPLDQTFIDMDVMHMMILAELAVEGTRAEDILGLWQAFHAALRHAKSFRDTTVAEYLRANRRGNYLKIGQPNFSPQQLPAPQPGAAQGPMYLTCSSVISLQTTLPA